MSLSSYSIYRLGALGLLGVWVFIILMYSITTPIMLRVSKFIFAQEKAEGFFRYASTRIRTYAESIAFYNGEEDERRNVDEKFGTVISSYKDTIRNQLPLNCKLYYTVVTNLS